MRNLPSWSVLPLVLVAFAVSAKEREPEIRNVTLPDGPDEIARSIFVAATIATVLRFEKEVDPARTEMVGWRGRFEPLLVGGNKVVVEPLYNLTSEDRFQLVVTLMDGTQMPFTLQAAGTERVDHQVNLFWDRESDNYLRASLASALARERLYREQAQQYEQEDTIDHALASLLAKGAIKLTPFNVRQSWLLKDEAEGSEIQVFVYTSRKRDKVAVVFAVKSLDPAAPWRLLEARLRTESGGERRPFALRTSRAVFSGGEGGQIAIVIAAEAFDTKAGLSRLVLEIFRKDGLQGALVELDPSILQ